MYCCVTLFTFSEVGTTGVLLSEMVAPPSSAPEVYIFFVVVPLPVATPCTTTVVGAAVSMDAGLADIEKDWMLIEPGTVLTTSFLP